MINRTPGKWSVTEIGRELYQRAVGTAGDFEEINADFKNTQNTISGQRAISVPRDFGLSFLRGVGEFQEKVSRYPAQR